MRAIGHTIKSLKSIKQEIFYKNVFGITVYGFQYTFDIVYIIYK
jgi:hypothetical protein